MYLKLQDKSLFEAQELLDHFKAYEHIYDNLDTQLSETFLKDTHKILTNSTIFFSKGYLPGEYSKTQMAAGDTIFPDPKSTIPGVPVLLADTQRMIDRSELHPIAISAKFHQYFIYLHPFPDGNGRLGRLISNFVLAKMGHPVVIITADKKKEYIASLKATHKHKDSEIITYFFASTAIQRMKNEMSQKKSSIPVFFAEAI